MSAKILCFPSRLVFPYNSLAGLCFECPETNKLHDIPVTNDGSSLFNFAFIDFQPEFFWDIYCPHCLGAHRVFRSSRGQLHVRKSQTKVRFCGRRNNG
jgi:hypothetical protein